MILLNNIWSNPLDNSISIGLSKFFDMLPDFLKELVIAFSSLGDSGIFLLVFGFLLLFIKKGRLIGITCLLSALFTLLFNDLIFKNIFDRARPFEDPLLRQELISIINNNDTVYGILPTSTSFPSGHTFQMFCAFSGISFLYIFKKDERKFYLPFIIIFGIFAFLMGFSRVLLSHHYFTDVLAGAILGFIIGSLNYVLIKYVPILYFKYFKKEKING